MQEQNIIIQYNTIIHILDEGGRKIGCKCMSTSPANIFPCRLQSGEYGQILFFDHDPSTSMIN